jgi:hypothetical protein
MKLLVVFYVSTTTFQRYPAPDTSSTTSLREYEITQIFGNSASSDVTTTVDLSRISCLSDLHLRSLTCIVRRSPALGEQYQSVVDVLRKYQSVSILKRPRMLVSEKKKQGKRRFDPNQIRSKASSRNQFLWEDLGKQDEGEEAAEDDMDDLSHCDGDNDNLDRSEYKGELNVTDHLGNDIQQEKERLRQKRYRHLRRLRERAEHLEGGSQQLAGATNEEKGQAKKKLFIPNKEWELAAADKRAARAAKRVEVETRKATEDNEVTMTLAADEMNFPPLKVKPTGSGQGFQHSVLAKRAAAVAAVQAALNS